jgi:hypothetical protein
MGCISSSFEDEFYVNEYLNGPLKAEFDSLLLTEQNVAALYKVFKNIDVDRSGNIAISELFHSLRIERTKFTERVFSIFDRSGNKGIEFRDFVLVLWNYCTLGEASLGQMYFVSISAFLLCSFSCFAAYVK